jgi:tripartite ATP-independent transporter DctM subunit
MEAAWSVAITIFLLALYLGLGTWIFAGLMLVSMTGLILILDMPISQLGAIMKGNFWRSGSTWELAAIPLFVWMGELIFRTDISNRMFHGLSPWVDMVPGRLLHTNILGCTLFAAVSGSSTATTATIGKITTVKLMERGYDDRLAIGSIAGAGTLGLMIPPSIVMIIYGILAEESIARLFAAGMFPGLLVAALYSTYIFIRCSFQPDRAPKDDRHFTMRDRLRGLWDLVPILVLIPIVLGGIYTGLATPSEAAALGVFASLVLIALMGQFNMGIFFGSLMGAVRITCMVVTIVVAASFMSSAMGYLHVPQGLGNAISVLGLGPYGLIALLFVFYIILGLFLEGISILVMSLPITLPLVLDAGFDRVWFGVFLVVTVELAQITPPVGLNLYVLQGLTGQEIGRIAVSALPFFLLLCLVGVIITIFPQIALWFPNFLYG